MSKILDELVAKGVSGEVIVEVAKLIAEVAQSKIDAERIGEHRARDAERKRVWRANVRGRPRTSQDVPGPNPAYIEERKKEKEVSKGRASRAKPKTPLPDDWHPVIATKDAAEFERFKNSAKDHARRYADWDAAWENWKTSPYQKPAGKNLKERNREIMDDLDEFIEATTTAAQRRSAGNPQTHFLLPLIKSTGT
jgi:hypothetical protein